MAAVAGEPALRTRPTAPDTRQQPHQTRATVGCVIVSRPQPPASRPSSAVNASHAAAGLLPALAASHSSVPT